MIKNHLIWVVLLALIMGVWGCKNENYTYTQPEEPSLRAEWEVAVEKGEMVFKSHCISCHTAPNKPRKGGTQWRGLFERYDDKTFVLQYILSSGQLIKDSNIVAIQLQDEYNNSGYNHEFKSVLSKEEIKNLMAFLKETIEKR